MLAIQRIHREPSWKGRLGVGFESGRGDTVYGGRAGLQWTWGGVRY